jgi:hypothetical protein
MICSFVECFVNGIGLDYLMKNDGLPPEVEATLRGEKPGGSFLSLEAKLEKIPQIISRCPVQRILTTDKKQIREPFLTFLSLAKSTRNSIAHHAQGKARIWYSPQDWNALSNKTAKVSLECSREFWLACYPNSNVPRYLNGLDFGILCSNADRQIESEFGGATSPVGQNQGT